MMDAITGALSAYADHMLPFILDTALKSSILLVCAAVAALAWRHRSAARRHLAWNVAITAALAMPILMLVTPTVELPWSWPSGSSVAPVVTPAPASELGGRATVAPADDVRSEAAVPAPEIRAGVGPAPASVIGAAPAPSDAPYPTAGARESRGRTAAPGRSGAASAGGGAFAGATVLLIGWTLGAVIVLLTLVVGAVRLRWLVRTTARVESGPLHRATARVSTRLGLSRAPTLLLGDDTALPMTWGLVRPFILLPAGADSWPAARLDAVLLHELGHVRRRDYTSQLAAGVACALYWFNPLAWLAAHRMRVERERACDDIVLSAGHEAASYARDLVALARSFPSRRRAAAIALGAGARRDMRRRLVTLLDAARDRRPPRRGRAVALGCLAFAVAVGVAALTPAASGEAAQSRPGGFDVPQVPGSGVRQVPGSGVRQVAGSGVRQVAGSGVLQEAGILCGPADGEARSRTHRTNDDRIEIESEYGECRAAIRIEGDLEFGPDFATLARLSSGASMRIEVSRPGESRRLEARPGPGGRPEYRWWVDGTERPFDAAAEAWLSAALVDVFRSTSYKAEERVAWILSRDGPSGVLREVEAMFADHARGRYLAILLERGELSSADVRQAIELAGRTIDSDHALGEVLMGAAGRFDLDDATRATFLRAATSLESDHQQGRVFMTALERTELSEEDLAFILDAAAESIESDHQLGELLIGLAARYPLEERLRDPFLRAAATMESDHQKGRVFEAVLSRADLTSGEVARIIESASGIHSDHELSELLAGVAERGFLGPEHGRAYLAATRSIGSDHALGRVLSAFTRADGVGETELIEALAVARTIGSDHQLSTFLVEFAGRHRPTGAVRSAFVEAMEGIGSDHARERVERALRGTS